MRKRRRRIVHDGASESADICPIIRIHSPQEAAGQRWRLHHCAAWHIGPPRTFSKNPPSSPCGARVQAWRDVRSPRRASFFYSPRLRWRIAWISPHQLFIADMHSFSSLVWDGGILAPCAVRRAPCASRLRLPTSAARVLLSLPTAAPPQLATGRRHHPRSVEKSHPPAAPAPRAPTARPHLQRLAAASPLDQQRARPPSHVDNTARVCSNTRAIRMRLDARQQPRKLDAATTSHTHATPTRPRTDTDTVRTHADDIARRIKIPALGSHPQPAHNDNLRLLTPPLPAPSTNSTPRRSRPLMAPLSPLPYSGVPPTRTMEVRAHGRDISSGRRRSPHTSSQLEKLNFGTAKENFENIT
ncbi:hypothetical protein C8J57DRAFT_1707026 [Mycena rebaudengoi]|nr:hypothetical protein C8J57DRAFT_1707026 [Mycena rebaudengoi]